MDYFNYFLYPVPFLHSKIHRFVFLFFPSQDVWRYPLVLLKRVDPPWILQISTILILLMDWCCRLDEGKLFTVAFGKRIFFWVVVNAKHVLLFHRAVGIFGWHPGCCRHGVVNPWLRGDDAESSVESPSKRKIKHMMCSCIKKQFHSVVESIEETWKAQSVASKASIWRYGVL